MIGSLFSGIGGLELGLERAGLGPVAWQVEIDPFCREVLARHWPDAARHTDVRSVGASTLAPVDLICGGFPCQDVSGAGLGRGLAEGTRSGLWYEYRRIVGELRPRVVVVENVASGKARWLCEVRSDLHALGYGTRAYALSAADVGAPHLRRRIFVVANGNGNGSQGREQAGAATGAVGRGGAPGRHRFPPMRGDAAGWAEYVAAGGPEPALRRGADGVSAGLGNAPVEADDARAAERLAALGNAVVPQCGEVIGRVLLEMLS